VASLRAVTDDAHTPAGSAIVQKHQRDGSLTLHTNHTSLASWSVGALLVIGLQFKMSTQFPVLISMNLFLISQWELVLALWGGAAGCVC
jgi:hypothetical protein